ncbi:serine/threonine-protein phosphatase 6 regulatory subunit 2-like isoform X1 [Brienomyrus brachyistius]|uniref:serine/threonine-protein phosphatase 6 regulatory subunit 2-like isoform X1 n=1 Tax=Brienomyrus brachyistius TaxID=42636 RepID=UPI0020B28405|nr:serine/threonine-protein phosphatase 6 regulatory subunit 2-like isoform X1 [Brienomyrus brachyistius]XP_048865084.1 serine/threonine-protein phosphatase 6 regulatory subunit 2-like isoform X1 [Brienomyrus brachyistius]XP_048865085.1 serine/threonine-protein phosphatase 6 regulatory subunit 2-like isoform X1 [Brienomyrus brachyistius]
MFWKFDLHATSNVDKLLDKEDVTLRELMDEDEVLQECKSQNRRLLTLLSQDECMRELVELITREPPLDVEEKLRFKYSNIACELLTSDVSQINEKLAGNESLLEGLYGFLLQQPPLNPLLASFFTKAIGNLIVRKTEQVIAFLRKKDEFISLVLKHINTSAMMDILLRLISCVEPAPLRQDVLNWLNEEKLIQRLVELIRSGVDDERQSNASQTLCDIIRLGRDQATQLPDAVESDPLLGTLESQESVSELLRNMFDGVKSETCIVNGTQVLLTLLEVRRPGVEGLMDLSSQGYERSCTVSSSILDAIEPHLKDFQQLLLDPPKKAAILTTIGVLEVPLGNARLHAARLVASLLQCCTLAISQELCRLGTVDLLLDLFFKYTWNNFLHLQVELCVMAILSRSGQEQKEEVDKDKGTGETAEASGSSTLVAHLFQKCRLVQRILDAWEENEKIQAEGGMRRGNMGHLTRIANIVVQNLEKGPVQAQISDLIKELPEDCRGRWESFVDETLTETNRRNAVELVSAHNLHSSSEDDDMESPFPNELSLQQAFSDYQIQQMTANFVDQFGFNDEEFSDHDDNINATFDRIAEINFNLDADDESANSAVFEACCKERIQQFDDEEEEDIWEDGEINYAKQVRSRTRFGVSLSTEGSCKAKVENGAREHSLAPGSDEDDEQLEPSKAATQMENTKNKNPGDQQACSPESPGWTANFEDQAKEPSPSVAVDVGSSVWDSVAPQQNSAGAEEKGWAKFTDFQTFCCSESGPRCSSPVDSAKNSSEGRTLQNQDKSTKGSSPCAWNVCGARKAPLVASDSSSSGGSDSEEEEDSGNIVTETITTGAGKETVKLSVDAKSEKAVFKRVFKPADAGTDVDSLPLDKLAVTDGPQRAATDPLSTTASSSAGDLAVTGRKGDAPPSAEASLNGPA